MTLVEWRARVGRQQGVAAPRCRLEWAPFRAYARGKLQHRSTDVRIPVSTGAGGSRLCVGRPRSPKPTWHRATRFGCRLEGMSTQSVKDFVAGVRERCSGRCTTESAGTKVVKDLTTSWWRVLGGGAAWLRSMRSAVRCGRAAGIGKHPAAKWPCAPQGPDASRAGGRRGYRPAPVDQLVQLGDRGDRGSPRRSAKPAWRWPLGVEAARQRAYSVLSNGGALHVDGYDGRAGAHRGRSRRPRPCRGRRHDGRVGQVAEAFTRLRSRARLTDGWGPRSGARTSIRSVTGCQSASSAPGANGREHSTRTLEREPGHGRHPRSSSGQETSRRKTTACPAHDESRSGEDFRSQLNHGRRWDHRQVQMIPGEPDAGVAQRVTTALSGWRRSRLDEARRSAPAGAHQGEPAPPNRARQQAPARRKQPGLSSSRRCRSGEQIGNGRLRHRRLRGMLGRCGCCTAWPRADNAPWRGRGDSGAATVSLPPVRFEGCRGSATPPPTGRSTPEVDRAKDEPRRDAGHVPGSRAAGPRRSCTRSRALLGRLGSLRGRCRPGSGPDSSRRPGPTWQNGGMACADQRRDQAVPPQALDRIAAGGLTARRRARGRGITVPRRGMDARREPGDPWHPTRDTNIGLAARIRPVHRWMITPSSWQPCEAASDHLASVYVDCLAARRHEAGDRSGY